MRHGVVGKAEQESGHSDQETETISVVTSREAQTHSEQATGLFV